MSSAAQVLVHPSQFPGQVRRGLIDSLRTRQINHKFLYEGVKQAQKWLALHQACSPARTDPDCAAIYEESFRGMAARVPAQSVHVVGLGCGGGQKDVQLLKCLQEAGKNVSYSPVDVSTAMVLVAREAVLATLPETHCRPLVIDLANVRDWTSPIDEVSPPERLRIISFFGMMPNFEVDTVMPALAALVRPQDLLLLSANLAPGSDYDEGVRRVMPLYDNQPTREWLTGFLTDLGIERGDGEMRFLAEEEPPGRGLKRIAAWFEFGVAREIRMDEEVFSFKPGEKLRVFFSYRHTPALIAELLRPRGLEVVDQWITRSQEEGAFLAIKKSS